MSTLFKKAHVLELIVFVGLSSIGHQDHRFFGGCFSLERGLFCYILSLAPSHCSLSPPSQFSSCFFLTEKPNTYAYKCDDLSTCNLLDRYITIGIKGDPRGCNDWHKNFTSNFRTLTQLPIYFSSVATPLMLRTVHENKSSFFAGSWALLET